MRKLTKFIAPFLIAMLLFTPNIEAASLTYTVKKGDTLYKIAKTYKVSVSEIKTWNKLTSDKLKLNMKLKINNSQSKQTVSRNDNLTVAKEFIVNSSAYTAYCKGCSGITATGINLRSNPNVKVIAVDPSIIPLGTKVYIEGYGYAIAADKGSAIKGNKIDIFFSSQQEALNWGRRTVKIKLLQ